MWINRRCHHPQPQSRQCHSWSTGLSEQSCTVCCHISHLQGVCTGHSQSLLQGSLWRHKVCIIISPKRRNSVIVCLYIYIYMCFVEKKCYLYLALKVRGGLLLAMSFWINVEPFATRSLMSWAVQPRQFVGTYRAACSSVSRCANTRCGFFTTPLSLPRENREPLQDALATAFFHHGYGKQRPTTAKQCEPGRAKKGYSLSTKWLEPKNGYG